MNAPATIGHNAPPDPIDEALAPYSDFIAEAESWLDGEPVTNEGQMQAVDLLLKHIRSAGTDLANAKKSATAPLHDAWKNEIARWKPTEEDLDRIKKGLAALVDGFKREMAAKKEEARRAAYEEARRKEDAARAAAAEADPASIDAQREAADLAQEAQDAKKAAAAANKDTVKGLRTVTKHEVTSHRDALHWIAKHDREAITAFVDEYARKHHRDKQIVGVRVWTEKQAY